MLQPGDRRAVLTGGKNSRWGQGVTACAEPMARGPHWAQRRPGCRLRHTRKQESFETEHLGPSQSLCAQTCPTCGWGDTQDDPHAHLPFWPVPTPSTFLPSESGCLPSPPHSNHSSKQTG